MDGNYILKDGKPVREPDTLKWAKWFEASITNGERIIEQTRLEPDILVSTVFLALDHSFGGDKPVLYETMIFGGEYDQHQRRYHTEEEARAGHMEALRLAAGASGVKAEDDGQISFLND